MKNNNRSETNGNERALNRRSMLRGGTTLAAASAFAGGLGGGQ